MEIALFLILAAAPAGPSKAPAEPEPIRYSEVVDVPGATQQELYSRAELWFAEAFQSANDVLQLEDESEGRLVAKAAIWYEPKSMIGSDGIRGPIRFMGKVSAKDGRFKYEFSEFVHEGTQAGFGLITTSAAAPKIIWGSGKGWREKKWNEIKATIDAHVALLIVSLKAAMGGSAADDDW